MRRQSREVALQILFQIEFAPQISFRDFLTVQGAATEDSTDIQYAEILVNSVKANIKEIDQEIQKVARNWKIDRMSTIDRNILRLGTCEMKFLKDSVPPSVAINESVEIAKKYGTTESSGFVNGILDQIAQGL